MKGTERNKPCSCGSGLKAKRCEHPYVSPYRDIKVVRVNDLRGRGRFELATSNRVLTAFELSRMVNG